MRKDKVIIIAGLILCILLGCIFVAVNSKMTEEQGQREEIQIIATILESVSQVREQVQESESMEAESEDSTSDATEEPEYTLVEKIANPLLIESASEDCEKEKPYVSYAEAEGMDPQAYEKQPKPYMNDVEEIRAWGEAMFYELVRHPERIDDYGAILTKNSVEAWHMFQWVYANPEDYYLHKYTYLAGEPGQSYYVGLSHYGIPPEYWDDSEKYDSLDHTFAEGVTQELLDYINDYPCKWYDNKVMIAWEYERDSGFVQIRGMDYVGNEGLHMSNSDSE